MNNLKNKLKKFTAILVASVLVLNCFNFGAFATDLEQNNVVNNIAQQEVVQEEIKEEEPQKEEPQKEEPQKEEPQKEEPQKEEPQKEEPKKEEPQKQEKSAPKAAGVAQYKNQGESNWTQTATLKEAFEGITTKGEVQLIDNAEIDSEITVAAGKEITFSSVGAKQATRKAGYIESLFTNNGTLKLTGDSSNKLTIDGNKANVQAIRASINNSGILSMTDGIVLKNNNNTNSDINPAGAVYNTDSGTFTMEGGTISGNTASSLSSSVLSSGGGIHTDGTFTMKDGEISGNSAGLGGGVNNKNTFTMEGGTISDNTSPISAGGGICTDGTFTMKGGTISKNTARVYGGGVYTSFVGTFTMENGTISENTASTSGGGVNADGTFIMKGGTISENTASTSGGGVFNSIGFITITGGTISGNTANNGNAIAITGGKFNLSKNAFIPKGTDGKQDIYLYDYARVKVTVDGELTKPDQEFLITPKTVEVNKVVVSVDGVNKTEFTDADLAKFKLNADGYTLGLSADKKDIVIKLENPVAQYRSQGQVEWTQTATLKEAFEAVSTEKGEIQLIKDTEIDSEITVPVGKEITFSSLGANQATRKIGYTGNLFNNLGTLKLTGSTQNKLTIDGNGDKVEAQKPIISSSGQLSIGTSSTLKNNNNKGGSGGAVDINNSTFTMSGGEISGNTASTNGGGVHLNNSTFTMSGGEIKENTAAQKGHAVSLTNRSTINLGAAALIPTGAQRDKGISIIGNDSKVIVNRNLNNAAQNFLIDPPTVDVGTVIASVDGTSKTGFTDVELAKFKIIKEQEYILKLSDDKKDIVVDKATTVAQYKNDGDSEWTNTTTLRAAFDGIRTKGEVRPIEDVYIDSQITVPEGKEITLLNTNGKRLDRSFGFSGLLIKNEGTLNLQADETNKLIIDGRKDKIKANDAIIENTGRLNMVDGVVIQNNEISIYGKGLRSAAVINSGTFTMNGGEIKGHLTVTSMAMGAGVYNVGHFTMKGGSISENTANFNGGGVCNDVDGTFIMEGGKMSKNYANFGGGIYTGTANAGVQDSSVFIMKGGEITENSTAYYGGGVYTRAGSFIMEGGKVTKNTSKDGGGIALEAPINTLKGGEISENTATTKGGAIYVQTNQPINLSGDILIPKGDDGKNNIHVFNPSTKFIVNDELTNASQEFLIMPQTFKVNRAIASVDGTIKKEFTHADLAKFKLDSADDTYRFSISDDKKDIIIRENVDAQYKNQGDSTWTKTKTLKEAFDNITTNGEVQLLDNITMDSEINIPSGKNITFRSDGEKELTRKSDYKGVLFTNNGTLNLTGNATNRLTIDGNKANVIAQGVMINNVSSGSILNITDGVVLKNNANSYEHGSAVYNSLGIVNMQGGEISGNVTTSTESGKGAASGVYNSSGLFTMNGGKITGNSSSTWAGGVYNGDTFTMNGGSITDNTAERYGGGVSNGGTFTMNGGSITDNTAKVDGGGVDSGGSASVIFTMTGGTIANNTASKEGSGVSLTYRSTFKLSKDALIPPGPEGKQEISMIEDAKIIVDGELTNSGQEFLIKPETVAVNEVVASVDGVNKTQFTDADLAKFKLSNADGYILSLSANKKDILIKLENPVAQYKNEGDAEWTQTSSFKEAFEGITSSKGEVQLLNNTEIDSEITVPQGKEITLSSDGEKQATRKAGYTGVLFTNNGTLNLTGNATNHLTIDGNKENVTAEFALINNNGTLSMTDGVTLTNNSKQGVYNTANFTMEGGEITGNTADFGGGVYNYDNATFVIKGGEIKGNSAESGGGVYNDDATFVMEGGEIKGNSAESGGGIYDTGFSTVKGGTIKLNTASIRGGAIFLSTGSSSEALKLSGNALIPKGADGKQDIHLMINTKIVVDGNLTNPFQEFLISLETTFVNRAIASVDGVNKTEFTQEDLAKFKLSNADGYILSRSVDNKDIIIKLADPVAHYKNEGAVEWVQTETLKDALEGVGNKGEVQLLKDTEIDSEITVAAGKDVTFSSVGEKQATRKAGYTGNLFTNNGTLKITGDPSNKLTIDGNKGEVQSASSILSNKGTAVVTDGVTLRNNDSSSTSGAINNTGVLTLEGGTITSNTGSQIVHKGTELNLYNAANVEGTISYEASTPIEVKDALSAEKVFKLEIADIVLQKVIVKTDAKDNIAYGNFVLEALEDKTLTKEVVEPGAVLKLVNKVVAADITMEKEHRYEGRAVEPEPEVKYHGNTLVRGTDYTVSYENNTVLTDDAKANVTLIGNYGTEDGKPITLGFKIVKGHIPGEVAINRQGEDVVALTYTGEAVANNKVEYQWYRVGETTPFAVTTPSDRNLKLTEAMKGKKIYALVKSLDSSYFEGDITSTSIEICAKDPNTGAEFIIDENGNVTVTGVDPKNPVIPGKVVVDGKEYDVTILGDGSKPVIQPGVEEGTVIKVPDSIKEIAVNAIPSDKNLVVEIPAKEDMIIKQGAIGEDTTVLIKADDEENLKNFLNSSDRAGLKGLLKVAILSNIEDNSVKIENSLKNILKGIDNPQKGNTYYLNFKQISSDNQNAIKPEELKDYEQVGNHQYDIYVSVLKDGEVNPAEVPYTNGNLELVFTNFEASPKDTDAVFHKHAGNLSKMEIAEKTDTSIKVVAKELSPFAVAKLKQTPKPDPKPDPSDDDNGNKDSRNQKTGDIANALIPVGIVMLISLGAIITITAKKRSQK